MILRSILRDSSGSMNTSVWSLFYTSQSFSILSFFCLRLHQSWLATSEFSETAPHHTTPHFSAFPGTSPRWLLSRSKPERLSFCSCCNYLLTPLPQNSAVSHRGGCRLRVSQSKLNSPPASLPSHFTPSLVLPNFIHASLNLNPSVARVVYPERSQQRSLH